MLAPLQVPEAPTTAVTFVEDLPEDEQDVEGFSKYGAGECQQSTIPDAQAMARLLVSLQLCLLCRLTSGSHLVSRDKECWQHMLHEQLPAMPFPGPGASKCIETVHAHRPGSYHAGRLTQTDGEEVLHPVAELQSAKPEYRACTAQELYSDLIRVRACGTQWPLTRFSCAIGGADSRKGPIC